MKSFNNKNLFFKRLAYLLREEDSKEKFSQEKKQDSIDDQVDRFLSQFESASNLEKKESRNRGRRSDFLFEAGEDEEAPPEEGGDEEMDAGGDDMAASDDAGGEEVEEEKIEKIKPGVLDVGQFAENVSRLVENYDSMLEMQNTILRRAINFINKTYDSEVVDELKYVLEEEYNMSPDMSSIDKEFEKFPAPAAQRAAGSGGGAA
jgi:hypothetical protein